jgi:predicted DCC family thiol-disulfide oxidoreductase YuxK
MTEVHVGADKILVVMDARCGLCAGGARWIARHDHADWFRIVPMQSSLGQALFSEYGIDPDDPASWLYLEGGKAMTGFEAWARVGEVIGGRAQLLKILLLIPAPLRARLYHAMARNRRRLFGTDDLCNLPDPAVARRLVQ